MTFVGGDKSTVAAAGKQQRLLPIVGIGLDRAEENDVVAAIITVDGATLKIRDTLDEEWRTAEPRRPIDTDKLVVGGFGEFVGERLLRSAQNVDREVGGVLKHAQA